MNPNSTALVPKEFLQVLQGANITTAILLSKSEKSNVNLKQNWTTKKRGCSDKKRKTIRWANEYSGPFDACSAESMRNDFLACLEDYQVASRNKLCPVDGIEIERQDISHRTIVEEFNRRKSEEKKSSERKGKERRRAFMADF